MMDNELKLIRIRRAEIAQMDHPSERKDEYIRLMRREAEILRKKDNGHVFRAYG